MRAERIHTSRMVIRNLITGEVITPARKPRPRLCSVCHKPAEFVEVEPVMSSHIDTAGTLHRYPSQTSRYYCAEHGGLL